MVVSGMEQKSKEGRVGDREYKRRVQTLDTQPDVGKIGLTKGNDEGRDMETVIDGISRRNE